MNDMPRALFIQFPPAEAGGLPALAAELARFGATSGRTHTYDSLFLTGADVPAALAVLQRVHEHLNLAAGCEQTVELDHVPPPEAVPRLSHGGANRLSFALPAPRGPSERAAWLEQSAQAIELATFYGLANVDLRLPLDPVLDGFEPWARFVASACDYKTPHVSLHAEQPLPPELYERAYDHLANLLSERHYMPYEPLHAAWPGYACRYLQTCLSGAPYDGLGPGAAGFDGGSRRYCQTAQPAAYRSAALASRPIPAEEELLTPDAKVVELFLTRLRLLHGLPLAELRGRMSTPQAEAELQRLVASYTERGYLMAVDERLLLTRRGRCWADHLGEVFLSLAPDPGA